MKVVKAAVQLIVLKFDVNTERQEARLRERLCCYCSVVYIMIVPSHQALPLRTPCLRLLLLLVYVLLVPVASPQPELLSLGTTAWLQQALQTPDIVRGQAASITSAALNTAHRRRSLFAAVNSSSGSTPAASFGSATAGGGSPSTAATEAAACGGDMDLSTQSSVAQLSCQRIAGEEG